MTTAMAAHPIVGPWLSDNNPEDPGTFVSYAAYHADGTVATVHPFAGAGIGAWRPTGARTGEALLKYLNAAHAPGEFAEGTVTVYATFEVETSGTTFTWHAMVEIATPDGLVDTFPSQSIGTRLEIAPILPPGTPTASTPPRNIPSGRVVALGVIPGATAASRSLTCRMMVVDPPTRSWEPG